MVGCTEPPIIPIYPGNRVLGTVLYYTVYTGVLVCINIINLNIELQLKFITRYTLGQVHILLHLMYLAIDNY